MCTCLDLRGINHYFGRTLDLDYHFNEEAVITPRGFSLSFTNGEVIKSKYAIIGTAMVFDGVASYYEAANEAGLAIAGLNFPYNASYNAPVDGMLNLTSGELISYFLASYESISDLRMDLARLNLTNLAINGYPPTPLHFMISDEVECIVVEQTKSGLMVYENDYGVMTNNPSFNLQIKHAANTLSLSNEYKEAEEPGYSCVGLSGVGLPGDFSSMSRFQRIAYLRKYIRLTDSENNNAIEFFHALALASMPAGLVQSKNGGYDITYYTSCINVTKGIYYYKTYYNNEIKSIRLNEENINSSMLTRYPLDYDCHIKALN